ncbi:hypothetical protein AMTRI_Chr04g243530 [Amborella trichopoda]
MIDRDTLCLRVLGCQESYHKKLSLRVPLSCGLHSDTWLGSLQQVRPIFLKISERGTPEKLSPLNLVCLQPMYNFPYLYIHFFEAQLANTERIHPLDIHRA